MLLCLSIYVLVNQTMATTHSFRRHANLQETNSQRVHRQRILKQEAFFPFSLSTVGGCGARAVNEAESGTETRDALSLEKHSRAVIASSGDRLPSDCLFARLPAH